MYNRSLLRDNACSDQLKFQMLDGSLNILVPSTTAVDHYLRPIRKTRAEPLQVSQGMGGFQSRDDALESR